MRIEIVIVRTEIDKDSYFLEHAHARLTLNDLKTELASTFKGLTVIPNTTGIWFDSRDRLIKDNSEIWLVYTKLSNLDSEILLKLNEIVEEIRITTKQDSQFYAIDNNGFTVSNNKIQEC